MIAAFTHVSKANGFELSPERLRSVRGASKREVIQSLVAEKYKDRIQERTNEFFKSFRESLAESYKTNGVHEVPGTSRTFDWLRSREIRIALNTGFDRFLTDLILENVGWKLPSFQAIVCGDDVAHGRPAPDLIFKAMELSQTKDPAEVANVGDTTLDLQSAANARVGWNIGVLSGAHKKESMLQFPHTHLIESVASIPFLWE